MHESEVLGGHGGWDLASLCQLGDRKRLRLEHLEHAKSVGMSQNLKALGGLSERLEARQMGWGRSRHGLGGGVSKDRFVGVLGLWGWPGTARPGHLHYNISEYR